MAELFNVIFAGELSGRAELAVVRANVGKMFNASEAVLDKLFSGQPVAVKKMVDRETAMKVRALMKQAGANTQMVQVDEQGRPVAAAPATSAPAASTPAAPASATAKPAAPAQSMAERVAAMAQQHAIEEAKKPKPGEPPPPAIIEKIETWALYPAGFRLSIPRTGPAPVAPVITGIAMAAAGSDILAASERRVVKPVQVDLSGISMAPPGTEVLKEEERAHVVPVQVDISGLSVAPVGAPLDEIREEKVLVNPDISGLSLAAE
ncbi:MAG: hypothetical protein Q8J78_14955 [Moraxellaceae bacterium]|nr:hypothetical protein [Moraxellaceae bacterium]